MATYIFSSIHQLILDLKLVEAFSATEEKTNGCLKEEINVLRKREEVNRMGLHLGLVTYSSFVIEKLRIEADLLELVQKFDYRR